MSTNLLQNMIDQAEANARDRAAQTLAAAEAAQNKQIAEARAAAEEALAPELWRAMGIDLDNLTMDEGAPSVIGEFEIAGHALIAVATYKPARPEIRIRIRIAAYDVTGRYIDGMNLTETELNPWESHRPKNATALADALRGAVALAPDARIKIAQRTRKAISEKIGPRCYRQPDGTTIDRTHARAVKAEIASAAPALGADLVADLRRQLCRQAHHARQYQAQERERRSREAERAEALRLITDAAKAYAAIYAQYSEAARAWALSATSDAWTNKPRELWTVRYGAVTQEADEDGETYRSAPQEIVTPDAGAITYPLAQNLRYHAVRKVEYDGTTGAIIIANVIDLTPYDYGTITTTRPMAYCRAYAAQPAGYFVNVPHGSDYYPPQPPALAEDWETFCTRTTGRGAPQTWRAYLDQGDPYANSIPF